MGEKIRCSSCERGHYEEVSDLYDAKVANVHIVIPRLKLLRCSDCGDERLPPDTQAQIDAIVGAAKSVEEVWSHDPSLN